MKYKKFIIYGLSIALIGSLIGIKLYTDKSKSNKSTVVTNDPQKSKTGTEVNITEATEGTKAPVSGTQSSLETSKLDITMIDTSPNTEGTTSGNLSNGGYFAKQGKWIYFTLAPFNKKQYPIYRAMSDGETGLKPITLPGTFHCINVIGDWVYYINENYSSNIYRTKTDGSRTEIVIESPIFNMLIKDGFIYYSDPFGISKKSLNTSKEDRGTLIAKGSAYNYFYIYGNLLYTSIYESKTITNTNEKAQIPITNLNSMNLDGTNLKRISSEFIYNFIISNGYIFYINISDYKLYRMNLNGSNKIQLLSYPTNFYHISNNNIYFEGDNENQNNIYRSDLNGKGILKITNNTFDPNKTSNSIVINYINNINVIDDYVYYLGSTGTDTNLYKTKTDGSLTRLLS